MVATTAHPPLTGPAFTVGSPERLPAALPDAGDRHELRAGMPLVTPASRPDLSSRAA